MLKTATFRKLFLRGWIKNALQHVVNTNLRQFNNKIRGYSRVDRKWYRLETIFASSWQTKGFDSAGALR